MGEIVFGLVIGALLGTLITLLLRRSSPSHLEDENSQLRYEVGTLRETVGGLQTLLGGKEKELSNSNRQVEEKQALLDKEMENNRKILSLKKSSEIRTGHVVEHLAPLMMEEYNPRNMKWLGQPIDYISFEDNGVYFIEVKSGKSHLSYNQKKIKKLVQEGKVFWSEFRIKGKGPKRKRSKK